MASAFIAWGISAAALLLLAMWLGAAIHRGYLGILLDRRGRYSLTQFQLFLWTILILSLISGVFWGRLLAGVGDALGFGIPNELLAVLGISVGSAAASTVVKAQKEASNPSAIAASDPSSDPPHFSQIFLVEEGPMADKVVDIAKYQNFWITIVLVVAYAALAIAAIRNVGQIADLKTLPGFSQSFLTLLLISHAGYIAGKIPSQAAASPGLTYAMLSKKATGGALPPFTPRRQVRRDTDAGAAPASPAAVGAQPAATA